MAEPGFFARICCCSKNGKEPPVTLISTNDLPNNAQVSSISPARETVDGFEDQALEVPKESESGPKEVFRGKAPKWKNADEEKNEESTSENKDEMNMNDVMMDDICGEEQDKPNVEDAVSIHTNVIEEVDESELRQMSEILHPKDNIEPQSEGQASSRSSEIVTLEQMLIEGYQSPRIEDETPKENAPEIQITEAEDPRDKTKEETEFEEMQAITKARENRDEDEDSELEEEIIIHEEESTPPTASPRSILKTTPSTARSTESVEDLESPPPPLPSSPPPSNEILEGLHHAVLVNVEEEDENKPKTMMYADADDSSDDDEKEEILPPVAKPEDDKTDVEEHSSDEEKSEKENKITRLSVKSNGQATITQGNVRIALESVEITDDEFSEKLI